MMNFDTLNCSDSFIKKLIKKHWTVSIMWFTPVTYLHTTFSIQARINLPLSHTYKELEWITWSQHTWMRTNRGVLDVLSSNPKNITTFSHKMGDTHIMSLVDKSSNIYFISTKDTQYAIYWFLIKYWHQRWHNR